MTSSHASRVRRFEEQILPHLPDLYRAARRLAGSIEGAEDLVQETCLRAFRSLDQLREPRAERARAAGASARAAAEAAREQPHDALTGDSPWQGALLEEARLATQRLP